MAAPMWRMNGLWRRMAGVLVLCTLLLSNEVMCQDDPATTTTSAPAADPTADATAVTDAAGPDAAPDATAALGVGSVPTVSGGAESASSGDNSIQTTTVNTVHNLDNQDGGTSETTAATTVVERARAASNEVPNVSVIVEKVVPDVKCVGKEDIQQSNALTAVVATNDCEASKRIIQENPAEWKCDTKECNLEIFQNGDTMLVTSKNAKLSSLVEALQSEPLKDKLGAKKIEIPSSSGSPVFVGILVSGLLAALAVTVGYFKCQRKSDTKGVRLAEEAYTVDQENQGNTLVSVAPLNPPPETQEKPSVNGESTEAAKTQTPPPTNGHSTTKTADTEL